MKKRLPFTALELVLVCAVAAILLSISLPAFYNISSGRRLTGSMSIIAANISLARARAVSDRTYTALIFPASTDDLGLDSDSKICNNAVRVAEVRKKTSGSGISFVFVKWLDGSTWESVGDGVVLPPGDSDNFKEEDQSGAPYGVSDVDFTDLKSGVTKDVARAIVFSPRGQIITQATVKPILIRAAEGTKIPGSDTFTLKKTTGTKTMYAVLTVNPLSGRTSVSYEED